MIERRLVSRPVSTLGTLIAPNRTQAQGPPVVTSGLMGYWDALDPYSYPSSGTSWTDISRSGNTGTLYNSPTFSRDCNGAILLDGTNQYIGVAHNASTMDFSLGQTVCIVLRPTHTGNNTLRRGIFHQAYGGPGSIIYNTTNVGGVHTFQYYFGTNGGDGDPYSEFNSSFTVIANEVAFICITRDQASDTCKWYKNADLITSGTAGGYAATANGTNPIYFGRGYTGISYFLGRFYFVAAYTRALSATEVYQNFQATRWRFGI